jgi:hypothetical protein
MSTHTIDTARSAQTTRRLAATAMATAALLAIAGFTALGSVFDYPKILKAPTDEILTAYRQQQSAVTGWFLILVISAALLAPTGVLLGRLAERRSARWIAGLGVVAASVQVTGLSRWVLLVPGVSSDAQVPSRAAEARHSFEQLHFWLGTVIGETIGYALTAAFTALVAATVTRSVAPRWMTPAGYASAALICTGVLIPFGLEAATLTNFAGYVLWCLWLIAMAVTLWRSAPVLIAATNTSTTVQAS